MFGSNTLEIAIGIILIFILVSTICAAIREGIEAKLKTRAAYLEQGIRQLLHDKDGSKLAKHLYQHPLINGLFNNNYKAGTKNDAPDLLAKGNDLPSYIPAKNFAQALMDIAVRGAETNADNTGDTSPVISLAQLRSRITNIGEPNVQRVLLNAIDLAQGDLDKAQANIENWFDSGMDRVSGWYKRSTQWIILWIGIGVSIILNINTITIINYLSENDLARMALVDQAVTLSKDSTSLQKLNYDKAKAQLNSMKLPIGYPQGLASAQINASESFGVYNSILGPLLGWLITALAATLGAPYWFDLLNRVMVIRSTVKPHEKSREEASQDNKGRKPQVVYVAAEASGKEKGTPNKEDAE